MTVFSALTTAVLPPAFVGEPYEASIAVNNAAVAELTLSAGTTQTGKQALPTGLAYGTDGRITGTPVVGDAGTYALSVKVSDGTTTKDNNALTLHVYDSRNDRAWHENRSVGTVVAELNM